jgi:hypothetical protein
MVYSKQQCVDAFNKLPGTEKTFFNSETVSDVVARIANDHALAGEKHRLLGEEVAYVLLHLNSPVGFQESARVRLNLTIEEAANISREMADGVFSPKKNSPAGQPRPVISTPTQTPANLPVMPEHHELMKYYEGTEPIAPNEVDFSGPVPLIKKKDQPIPPKLADTPRYDTPKYVPPQQTIKPQPRYNPGTDPYREPSK